MISTRKEKHLDVPTMFTYSHASSRCRIFSSRSDRLKFVHNSISKFFVYCCHSDIDFTKNHILTNCYSKSITGENFVAIGQDKVYIYKRLKNIGMVPEKLYRNTLMNVTKLYN